MIIILTLLLILIILHTNTMAGAASPPSRHARRRRLPYPWKPDPIPQREDPRERTRRRPPEASRSSRFVVVFPRGITRARES